MGLFACGCVGAKKKKSGKSSKKGTPKVSSGSYNKPAPPAPARTDDSRSSRTSVRTNATHRIRTNDFPSAPMHLTLPTPYTPATIVAEPPIIPQPERTRPYSATMAQAIENINRILEIPAEEVDAKRRSHMLKSPYEIQQQQAALDAISRGESPNQMQPFFPALNGEEGQKLGQQFHSELETKFKLKSQQPTLITVPTLLLPLLKEEAPRDKIQPSEAETKTEPEPEPKEATQDPSPAQQQQQKAIEEGNREAAAKNSQLTPPPPPPAPAKANRPGRGTTRPMQRNEVSSYRTGTVTARWNTDYNASNSRGTRTKKERTATPIEEFNRELEAKLRKRSIYLENTAKANGVKVY